MKPFVKWAGGKKQLLDDLLKYSPKTFNRYFEPFVGGGAFLFKLQPRDFVINDINSELISTYKCFTDEKEYKSLIKLLNVYEKLHSEEQYYQVRALDREANFKKLRLSKKAARLIYLNKSCFNGLHRVNKEGFNNVPSGKKAKVKTFEKDNFEEILSFFQTSQNLILNGNYKDAVQQATKGDFVYFDPPYDPIENKNSFTTYAKDSFGKNEQIELRDCFKELSDKGVFVMLSNHNTQFIRDLYKDFNIHIIKAKRIINSKADGRGYVEEVIITNY